MERDPSCRTFQKTHDDWILRQGLAHIVSTAHAAEIECQLVVPDEESTCSTIAPRSHIQQHPIGSLPYGMVFGFDVDALPDAYGPAMDRDAAGLSDTPPNIEKAFQEPVAGPRPHLNEDWRGGLMQASTELSNCLRQAPGRVRRQERVFQVKAGRVRPGCEGPARTPISGRRAGPCHPRAR